jgi:hypothetical protein
MRVSDRILIIAVVMFLAVVGCKSSSPCPEGGRLAGKAPPQGKEEWCEREDQYGNFVRHGRWTRWQNESVKLIELLYRNGKAHGPFLMWHENGQMLFKGECQEGLMAGTWTMTTDLGKPLGSTEYSSGLKRRIKTFSFTKGTLDTVEVYNGNGRHLTVYKDDGTVYLERTFSNGRETRYFEYENGSRTERPVKDPLIDEDWPYRPQTCAEMLASIDKAEAKTPSKGHK